MPQEDETQAHLNKIDALQTYQAAMEEYCKALEQLVRDYDNLLLLNPLNIMPPIVMASSQVKKWYASAREIQVRKRELLHESPDAPG